MKNLSERHDVNLIGILKYFVGAIGIIWVASFLLDLLNEGHNIIGEVETAINPVGEVDHDITTTIRMTRGLGNPMPGDSVWIKARGRVLRTECKDDIKFNRWVVMPDKTHHTLPPGTPTAQDDGAVLIEVPTDPLWDEGHYVYDSEWIVDCKKGTTKFLPPQRIQGVTIAFTLGNP